MPVIRRAARYSLAIGALAAVVVSLSACVPEPDPSASTSPSASVRASASPSVSTPTAATSSPTSSPSPTAAAGPDITLPTACEQLYSPAMLAQLQQQTPPLNDSGVTMYSTQVVEALEVLNSGVPTLRCSWGMPSESGLATNVSIVDAAASATILDALRANGFSCEASGPGTLCTFAQESITQEDVLVRRGETHYLAGNGWVSTAWITIDPDGYTADVVASLWG